MNKEIILQHTSLKEIGMKPKIVTFDIENTANLLWSWQVYGGSRGWNAIDVLIPWRVICFGAKWLGKKTEMFSVTDYEGYKPFVTRNPDGSILLKPFDDYDLMVEMRNILDEADIVIGWNSKRFDVKKVQSRMIALGIEPPSPFKQIDVMQEKKKVASSNYNHLDKTGEEWGTGRKLEHEGWKLWEGCMEDDAKAWSKMHRYCAQDVNLTEKNYLYLRPWMANHPSLNVYTDRPKDCPVCMAKNTLIKRGSYQLAGGRLRQTYQCAPSRDGCGRYSKGEFLAQEQKIIAR